MSLRTNTVEIRSWAEENVRPTALSRRTDGTTEPLIRTALQAGMSDWLVDERAAPNWVLLTERLSALAEGAADLGFGASVMVQNLVAGLHLGLHAKAAGARKVLSAARRGEKIVSFAVTEPEVGSHPAKLKATAERIDENWRLRGTKTFSTNGMIADEVLVVGVTGEQNGRRSFAAVLVPSNAEGFSREDIPMAVCPTATHAKMTFDVTVPHDRIVGEEGTAYLNIVRPFRAYEDLAGAALFKGHLRNLEADADHLSTEARGRLRALLQGLHEVVYAAAGYLNAGKQTRHDMARLAIPYLLEPAVELVANNPSDDPLWQARVFDLGMANLGANVRKRFFEKLGA